MTRRIAIWLALAAGALALLVVLNVWASPVRGFAPPAWVVDAWAEGARCAGVPARSMAGVTFVVRRDLRRAGAVASWDEDAQQMQFAARDSVTWTTVVHEAAHAHRHDRTKVHPRAVRDRCPALDTWYDY